MADKEKRIAIHQVLYPCKKCSINCNKNDWKDCDFYQNYISGMTRTEVVERMANAIYFKACGTIKDYARCKKVYIPFAEAALDAVLGGKK